MIQKHTTHCVTPPPPKIKPFSVHLLFGIFSETCKDLGKIKLECLFDTWKIHYFISRNNFILTQGNKNYK